MALFALTSSFQGAFAEQYCLRARCKKEKRLAPELALVRHAKSHYIGVCRDGKAVFDVPAGQVQTMRTMATIDEEAPAEPVKSNRLLISYSGPDQKPSEETLRLLQTTTKFFYQPSPAVFSAKLPHR
jgi:hypothetical protein